MITDRKEALEGLKEGDLALAEIAIELRSDSEIAVEAIKQYGESAITFLAATNSLPHTPEVFLTILEGTKNEIDKNIKTNTALAVEELKKENDIDKLMEMCLDLETDLANINSAIKKLEEYKDKIVSKEPEKGGQEH